MVKIAPLRSEWHISLRLLLKPGFLRFHYNVETRLQRQDVNSPGDIHSPLRFFLTGHLLQHSILPNGR